MQPSLADAPSRRSDVLTVAVFLLIIGIPPLMLFRPGVEERIAQTERRQAATVPKLEFQGNRFFPKTESLRQFPRTFEAWFNDHLGFRRSMIGLFNLAKVSGLTCGDVAQLSVGRETSSSVLVGRDEWLFYTGERVIDDYRCINPLTRDELTRWRQALQDRQRWLENRGIRYLVFVAPNKHSIYGEYLPRAINRVGRQSRLDQLVEELNSAGNVDFVDLRPALIEAKSQFQTYHKTDTHWNEFGAYVGYRRVMQTVATWFPQVAPVPLSAFETSIVETEGDYLATLLHSPFPIRETRVELTPRKARTAQFTSLPTSDGRSENTISTKSDAALPTVLMLGDSFMAAFAPYLSEHFQRVRYVRTYDFDPDLIDEERPVLVIQEYVERRLMHHIPSNPATLHLTDHLAETETPATLR